ncbi:MAG: type II toxin-antitoxin system VapB family antitoxin [Balneolaceae bacterium]
MALSIKNKEVDRLARDLAEITGENLTEAIANALKERLERETGRMHKHSVRNKINRIQKRVSRLQKLDNRSDDEIIGYDKSGLPN